MDLILSARGATKGVKARKWCDLIKLEFRRATVWSQGTWAALLTRCSLSVA